MPLRQEQAERCQEAWSCAASRSLDRKMLVMNFQMKVNCVAVTILKSISHSIQMLMNILILLQRQMVITCKFFCFLNETYIHFFKIKYCEILFECFFNWICVNTGQWLLESIKSNLFFLHFSWWWKLVFHVSFKHHKPSHSQVQERQERRISHPCQLLSAGNNHIL